MLERETKYLRLTRARKGLVGTWAIGHLVSQDFVFLNPKRREPILAQVHYSSRVYFLVFGVIALSPRRSLRVRRAIERERVYASLRQAIILAVERFLQREESPSDSSSDIGSLVVDDLPDHLVAVP